MRPILAALLALLSAQPAFACSGYPTRSHQSIADVIVSGRVTQALPGADEFLMPRKVLKGTTQSSYRILWPVFDDNDECRFLAPVHRNRGVFFLQRRPDGAYVVNRTEKHWKMVR